ncbi:YSIRK signal domain/LPXTG anchor domain surface protein [Limosilactobacillus mucosae]|uniref:YSIRK signal domain/LPXTG anchor domain surface protein n=1 Tax=Limosilactobacillus mucosae TaxID=97478 RepID=UPI00065281D0|nr:YSIRK signal domain/LPXTG anchor domain surface protein [Limosilactobacillus mucosae]
MVSKNNYRLMTERCFSHQQHWGLRKLSIGVASVLLGTAIIAQGSVYADTQTTPSDSSENSVDKTVDNPTDSGQTYVLKSSANSAASDNSGTPTSSTDNATSASTPNESAANEDTDINGVPTTFTRAKSAVTGNGDSNPNTKESGEYWPDTKGASIKNYDKTTSTDFSTDKAASENHAIDPSTIKGYDQEYSDTPNLMHTQDLHLYVNGKEVDISTLQDDDKLNDNSEYPNHNSKGHARLIKVSDFGTNTYFYARNAVQKYNQITGEIDHYDVKWTLESVNYANEQALLAFGIKGILDGGGNLLFNVGSGWQVAKRGNFANTHLQFFKEINVHKFANQDGTLKETVTEAIKNGDIVATALKIHEGFTDLDNNEAIEISENAVHRVLVDDSATLAYQKTNDGYLAITRTYNDISDHDAKFNNANQVVALLELDVPKEGFDLSIATSGPSTKGEMAEGSKVAPAVLDTVAYLKTLTVNYYELGENGNPTTIKLKDTKTAHNFIGKSYGLQNTDQDQDGKQDAFDYSAPQEITDQDGTTWRLVKQTGNNLKNHTYQDCLNVINYYYQKSEVRRQGTESVTYKFYNDQEKTELVKEITKTPVYQDGKWQWQVKETDYDDQGNETHQSITTDGLIEGLSADQATVKFTGTVNYDSNGKASGTTWDANNSTYGTIKTPAIEGYTADKPSVGGETVSPNDSSLNREYKVVYTQNRYHKGKDTETKDVTRTIEYYDNVTHEPIPSNLESTVTQTATLKRNKIYDDQNNFIGYGTVSADGSSYTIDNSWKVDAQTWTQQDSTDLSDYGYTAPDRASVATVTVDGSTTNVTEKVYYGHQTMPVTPTNPGTPGKPINPKGDAKYPKGITKNDLTATVKRTINYVDENGNKVNGAPDGTSTYVQTAEFTRTAIVDKVTGKILGYDTNNDGKVDTESADRAWTPIEKTLEAVKSADPSSVGYDNVDIANVSSLVVTPDQGNKTVKVTYNNNPVSGTIKYIDDTTGVELDSDNLPSGKIGSTINYKTADKIKSYKDQGYELVSNDFTDGSQVYKKTGNDFVVRLKHKTQTITPNDPNPVTPGQPINPNNPNSPVYPTGVDHKNLAKDATQTIHYIGAGDKTPADNIVRQKDAFTRTVTIDKVTGKILTITPWSTKTFNTVNTPVVNGYHADKKVAGGLTATVDNPNVEDTVNYAPNGKLIPVDPNGKPIPGADTPTYTTDPKNPTKVLNPTVPSIDGWEPKDKRPGDSITPKDPGRDTPVPYDQVVSGTIKYIDDTTGKELSSENLAKGTVGSKISYTTKDKIKDYEGHGYELVSNNFTDGTQTYAKEGNDFVVHLKHAIKESVSYKDATQTIHYTGVGSDTLTDKVQTEKNAFSKTDTVDKVTGEVTKTTGWVGTKTFGTEDTPVVNGYHADKKVAGGLTATVDNPNVEETVTYAPNGKLIPVDENGTPIPGANTPTYTTDSNDPTKVLNPTVPRIDGWQPKDNQPGDSITPNDPGKDTKVPYVQVVSGTIKYIDDTTGKELSGENLKKGTVGSKIDYQTADKIKDYENQGYELVSNDFTDGTQTYAKEDNDFIVHLKHATKTITPEDPATPGDPINPNDPNSPVYPTEVDHKNLAKDATQTIHYIGAGDKTPVDNIVRQKDAFTRTITIDKVTGKILSITPWSTKTFNTVNTPVVNGYHADKKTAGGLTATVDNPNVEETVTYAPNGKLIPVDENGKPIPGANTPTYTTDSNDPTKVLSPTVPRIDGRQPKDNQPGDSITPKDPGKDTPVIYVEKPQKPVMPVVPEQPENPAVPNNSEQPRTPDQPDNSKQPSKPTITDQPNDSIVPNNAKHLAALTPRDQSQGISAVPGDSKQRATVSNSVAAVSEKETTLPQTGNDKNQAEAAMGLGLTSLSTIMAMLGLKKRRHN